jgi:prevent-host-death family protein
MAKSTASISVGVHEAKTRLSELLRAVATGQEVEILRNGDPIARIVPIHPHQRRRFGFDVGKFDVPADFDAALPAELLADFER